MPAAEAGTIWLYLPEAAELRAVASRGYGQEALSQIHLPPGVSVARAYATGQAVRYGTPKEAAACIGELSDPQRGWYEAAAGVKHARSILTAPLRAGVTKLGVVALEILAGARRFTAAELRRLQAAADVLALGLWNARLRGALREAQTANEASRTKDESISFLAHEMRTPLTTIKGYATALLMEDARFDAAAQREFLEQIDRECDTLIRLIEDLLESSVLDAGRLELERQPLRMRPLVQQVADEIRLTAPRHRLLVEIPRDLPLVEVDAGRLVQVLRNLLENAVKYSPQGGLIVVRGETRPTEVVISVADQGVGIAPEHLNRLFEKYFRVKSGATRATIGSGLGLPIARSIVEAHGGRIWAESQPGQGSIFYFSLPLVPLERETAEGRAESDE